MKSILTVALFAAALPALLPAAGDLLPLENGNAWTYREAASGETFTIRVGTPIWFQSGRTYYPVRGYLPQPVLARTDEAGNLVQLNEETGEETLLTGFAIPATGWWQAPGRECPLQGLTPDRPVPLTTRLGHWERTLAIEYRSVSCADAGPAQEFYAANLGLLRRTITTIAGPRTFDLVHARVGSLVLDLPVRGRFTVSLEANADKRLWLATLRLDVGSASGIRLAFPSAQQYEVVLRNPAGEIVWRWSDGKFFAEGSTAPTLSNHWSAAVEIPFPEPPIEGHTVEAWLTTAPGEPRFAAAAPLP